MRKLWGAVFPTEDLPKAGGPPQRSTDARVRLRPGAPGSFEPPTPPMTLGDGRAGRGRGKQETPRGRGWRERRCRHCSRWRLTPGCSLSPPPVPAAPSTRPHHRQRPQRPPGTVWWGSWCCESGRCHSENGYFTTPGSHPTTGTGRQDPAAAHPGARPGPREAQLARGCGPSCAQRGLRLKQVPGAVCPPARVSPSTGKEALASPEETVLRASHWETAFWPLGGLERPSTERFLLGAGNTRGEHGSRF